jgi:hypothetical protein
MKIFYNKTILTAMASSMLLLSCSDWLDVRPKSEILSDVHFENESGYRDQLIGVYSQMSSPEMYGKEMTFGLTSVLSQDYDLLADGMYRYAAEYNYREITTKNRVDAIWSSTYNCIANLNIMLEYIDKANPDIFSDRNHDIYKGEALGLRAFLHLDMLRLFSPSPKSAPDAPAIPYVAHYGKAITVQQSVNQTLDLIINDLIQAIDFLKADPMLFKDDYIYTERSARKVFFNYYAAVATLVRAYMYKGDKTNALKYADMFIEEDANTMTTDFGWVHYTAVETTYENQCDRIFSREMIFYLNIKDLDNIVKYYFTSAAGSNTLAPSEEKADEIFERTSKGYGNDYRMLKGFAYEGDRKYFWKYHQYEGGYYNDILPVIRKTEVYYIAAEILKDSDPARAVELLNLVRDARNLDDFHLSSTLSADEIQQEIQKEYRKEFLGEGQMFYYYKRQNAARIEGAAVNAGDNVYVLPMPDNEIEFGNRK